MEAQKALLSIDYNSTGSKQTSILRDTERTAEACDIKHRKGDSGKSKGRKGRWKVNEWNLLMRAGVVLVADIHFPALLDAAYPSS